MALMLGHEWQHIYIYACVELLTTDMCSMSIPASFNACHFLHLGLTYVVYILSFFSGNSDCHNPGVSPHGWPGTH
jgi:hypothetical protein